MHWMGKVEKLKSREPSREETEEMFLRTSPISRGGLLENLKALSPSSSSSSSNSESLTTIALGLRFRGVELCQF